MRYRLQNRYQDSGWMNLDQEYEDVGEAVLTAAFLSCDSICYGMVRVLDLQDQVVLATFPAGAPYVKEQE